MNAVNVISGENNYSNIYEKEKFYTRFDITSSS